jgi:uncharacterized protein (TIGR01732 family)
MNPNLILNSKELKQMSGVAGAGKGGYGFGSGFALIIVLFILLIIIGASFIGGYGTGCGY